MVTVSIASKVGLLLQAHQQVQWEAEQHSSELQAAQWCDQQIQAVRKEAAEAVAAAEAICDSRCMIVDNQAASQSCIAFAVKFLILIHMSQ